MNKYKFAEYFFYLFAGVVTALHIAGKDMDPTYLFAFILIMLGAIFKNLGDYKSK